MCEALTTAAVDAPRLPAKAATPGVGSTPRSKTLAPPLAAPALKAAESMDPGQFVGLARNFEHRVDAASALAEANRAHARRYLQIGEPFNGLVRIEGQVTPDAGAIIRTALEPYARPSKSDERSAGQRMADALLEVCRGRNRQGSGSGPRTQVIITAAPDTLAGIEAAPAGQLRVGRERTHRDGSPARL